MKPNTVK